jgi:multidrug resistance efflux pump
VHKGDLLMQIDPRTHEALHDQAVATKSAGRDSIAFAVGIDRG